MGMVCVTSFMESSEAGVAYPAVTVSYLAALRTSSKSFSRGLHWRTVYADNEPCANMTVLRMSCWRSMPVPACGSF